MKIDVKYKDTTGYISKRSVILTRLALFKHLAIAGQGYAPALNKVMRTIGMMLHYYYYIQKDDFDNNRFSEPPKELSDPTEKAQFSNLVGKAIADYLSKKIDKSIYTVNYEAVMRMQGKKLVGSRPDLIAYCPKSVIAIEAKGRHDSTPGNMQKYKVQSQSGSIIVNSSVACVSYNLFQKVNCNYYDPIVSDSPYDNEILRALSRSYYAGLKEYLNKDYFRIETVQIGKEKFYEIKISELFLRQKYSRLLLFPFYWVKLFQFYNPRLLLPINIEDLSKKGLSSETRPFEYDSNDSENLYIDNDRVGFKISS
jgi:hypothetical protein